MRLVFSRCHGENPVSFGVAGREEAGELVECELFIREILLQTAIIERRICSYKVTAKVLKRQGYEDKETAGGFNLTPTYITGKIQAACVPWHKNPEKPRD